VFRVLSLCFSPLTWGYGVVIIGEVMSDMNFQRGIITLGFHGDGPRHGKQNCKQGGQVVVCWKKRTREMSDMPRNMHYSFICVSFYSLGTGKLNIPYWPEYVGGFFQRNKFWKRGVVLYSGSRLFDRGKNTSRQTLLWRDLFFSRSKSPQAIHRLKVTLHSNRCLER